VLENAVGLVLVTTSSMHTSAASLRLFTRNAPGEEWTEDGKAEAAVVGRAGLAWGAGFLDHKRDGDPEKVEGDRRTPAGFFRIGPTFGFEASTRPGHIVLKRGETVCVDDPSSPAYSKIVRRRDIGPDVSAEDMRSIPHYRQGLVVDYPGDREARRGSCIFIHVWRAPTMGTAGCVALPERRVRKLQEFSRRPAAIAMLPQSALERFRDCLPSALTRPVQGQRQGL
jgi:L,D-peptidoglycan transpeptidase YkuD (ErfK/YbiS/YcfS/YnhG family)